MFAAIKGLVGRPVPASDKEARLVLDFWNQFGPIPREAFLKACECTQQLLGSDRAITAYLDHLERQVVQSNKED